MNQDPLVILLVVGVSAYLGKLWLDDYRDARPGGLPGATSANVPIVLIGIVASLVLVLAETVGEWALGIGGQQSTVTWLFLLAMLAAGFLEELIFRGYLVIDRRGRGALVASILGFSALFALAHFHWAEWTGLENGWIELRLTTGAFWWTLFAFLNSLLFYGLRFSGWNPRRSLIPCFAGHMIGNLAVFVVKWVQGFVSGLY